MVRRTGNSKVKGLFRGQSFLGEDFLSLDPCQTRYFFCWYLERALAGGGYLRGD